MREALAVGRLWDLVQNYLDHQDFPVSERQLAMKLGYASSSTFDGWRNPKSLPATQGLARFAALSRTPYQRVLDAALEDIGYLPEPKVTGAPLGPRRATRAQIQSFPPDEDLDDIGPEEVADPVFGEELEQRAARKKSK